MDNVISNKMTLSEEYKDKDLLNRVAGLNIDGDVNESFDVCRSEEDVLPHMKHVMITDVPFGISHFSGTYPAITHLILDDCDKNFIYVGVSRRSFPNVKNMWLFSHPCGGGGGDQLYYTFERDDFKLVVLDEYEKYFYFCDRGKITFISRSEAETFKSTLDLIES